MTFCAKQLGAVLLVMIWLLHASSAVAQSFEKPVLHKQSMHTQAAGTVVYSRSGKNLFASGSEDATIKLYEATTGREIQRLVGHKHWPVGPYFKRTRRACDLGCLQLEWFAIGKWWLGQQRARVECNDRKGSSHTHRPHRLRYRGCVQLYRQRLACDGQCRQRDPLVECANGPTAAHT